MRIAILLGLGVALAGCQTPIMPGVEAVVVFDRDARQLNVGLEFEACGLIQSAGALPFGSFVVRYLTSSLCEPTI